MTSTTSTSQHLCDAIDELSRLGFEKVKADDLWLRGTSSKLVLQVAEMEPGTTYSLDCESKSRARDRRVKVSQAITRLRMSDKVTARSEGTKLYIIRL